jgi:hypothetical protein
MPRRFPLVILAVLCLAPAARSQTAFRFTELALRDPHVFAILSVLGCRDITDTVPLNLAPSFNESLQESIDQDENGDGWLDLNGLIFFVTDEITVGTAVHHGGTSWDPGESEGELIFHFGGCLPPAEAPVCEPDVEQAIHRLDYANEDQVGCLGPVESTLGGYEPAPVFPAAPCFFGEPFDAVLEIGGIPVPLIDMQLAATHLDVLPPRLVDGVVRGFLREAAADSVTLPTTIPLVGGEPLSTLLPGSGNCCASGDDRDVGPGGETGWWLYFDFEADEVPFTPATAAPERGPAGSGGELRAAPNPFTDRVSFTTVVPHDGGASLEIVDVRGRRVRTLTASLRRGTRQEIAWDGSDARGRPLPAGVYFARLETAHGVVTRKVVRAR